MAIRLNYYLGTKNAEDGTVRLFGKVGYQTQSPKTDKYTLINMATIEKQMKAGKLRDLEGNVVYNNAVIDVYALATEVGDDDTLETVGTIRNSVGEAAKVEEAPAASEASDDEPF